MRTFGSLAFRTHCFGICPWDCSRSLGLLEERCLGHAFILFYFYFFRTQSVEVSAYLKTPPFEELQRVWPELQRWRAPAPRANCFFVSVAIPRTGGGSRPIAVWGCGGVGGVRLRDPGRGRTGRFSPCPLVGSSSGLREAGSDPGAPGAQMPQPGRSDTRRSIPTEPVLLVERTTNGDSLS